MIINTRIDPQPGELFEAECFDVNIGEDINVMIEGSDHVGRGVVIAVSVADDGSHAWFTFEVPDLASDSVDIGPMILSAQEGPGFTGCAEEGI